MLIPLHCEYFALEGLGDLVATLRRVRAALNPGLDIEGVLLTMNDERTNLGQQVARDVREFFKDKVYTTVIPRNVRLAEAPSHGQSVMTYDPRSRGAEAYAALAQRSLHAQPARGPQSDRQRDGGQCLVERFQGSRVPRFQGSRFCSRLTREQNYGTVELLEPWNLWNLGTLEP